MLEEGKEEKAEEQSNPVESQTEGPNLFSTAVPEEKLQEAREKSKYRIFGPNQLLRQIRDKNDEQEVHSLPHIVEVRVSQHYEAGLAFLSRGDAEEAVISFSKAINLKPEEIQFYVKRAEAFLYLCDFQSAALNLRKACSVSSPSDEHLSLLAFTLYLQGQCLFDQGCYLRALESFTCASEIYPWKPYYHFFSIACLVALGRNTDCLRLVNKQMEEDKGNPDLYVLRARLNFHFNKATLCYQDLQQALRLDSNHTAGQTLKYNLEIQAEEHKAQAVNKAVEGKLQEALSKICFAIEHHPTRADYYAFRGTLYRRLQDFSSAMDDFVHAMQLTGADKGSPETSGTGQGPLVVSGDVKGRKPEGAEVVTRTTQKPMVNGGEIESSPGLCGDVESTGDASSVFSEAQKQLLLTYNDFAVHCYNKGFYQEGVLLLNKAIKGQKQEMGLYMNRGDCLFQLGELNLALADYQQALDLSPMDSGVRHRIAMLQNELGLEAQQYRRYQEAELLFSQAIQNQPRLPSYYLHRAQVRQCLQDQSGAQEDALTALLLDPKNPEAEPLVTSFFPGKSLFDVLNSKLCEVAKEILERNLLSCPILSGQDNTKWEDRQEIYRRVEDAEKERNGPSTAIIQSATTKDLCTEMLNNHKKIGQEIQKVLHEKKTLTATKVKASSAVHPSKEAEVANARQRWRESGSTQNHQGSRHSLVPPQKQHSSHLEKAGCYHRKQACNGTEGALQNAHPTSGPSIYQSMQSS